MVIQRGRLQDLLALAAIEFLGVVLQVALNQVLLLRCRQRLNIKGGKAPACRGSCGPSRPAQWPPHLHTRRQGLRQPGQGGLIIRIDAVGNQR